MKPTQARVSLKGVLPLAPSLDSVGPLANRVSCCSGLDSVLNGGPGNVEDAPPLAELSIGVVEGYVDEGLDDAVASAFAATLKRLAKAVARLEPIKPPYGASGKAQSDLSEGSTRVDVAQSVAHRRARRPDLALDRIVELDDEVERRCEGDGAEQDRDVDDGVARRNEAEHPEEDREPSGRRGQKRPGNRVADRLDDVAAALQHLGHAGFQRLGDSLAISVGRFELADCHVDPDQHVA